MRAYVIESGIRIAPFDESPASLTVGGVTLLAWQDALFARFGLEVVRVRTFEEIPTDAARIVTYDHVFFSRRVLKSFLAKWKRERPAQLALPIDSGFIRAFSALQDFERDGPHARFGLYGLPPGAQGLDAEPLGVVYEERMIEVPIPEHVTGHSHWLHPLTTSVCLHLTHWLHVLQANRLAIQIRWVDEIVQKPWVGAWIILRGLIPGRGRLLWRVLAAANRIGKDVDIHPTARLEGCFVGDGARIGAYAIVRASLVGPGAIIEERATVAYSVIGARSFVSKHTVVYSSACMEASNLGMSMQMCIAGRRAALTPRATPIDVIPGGTIKVEHEGRYIAVDLPVLGSCYGHDVFVGADIYVAPGRALPNGLKVGPNPERVLSSLPDRLDEGGVYVVRDGRLAPFRPPER